MTLTAKALASLLARAYSAEFSEAQIIAETLLYTADDDIWGALFNLMKDNEIHRIMIEEAVELLGFDVKSFKEYAIETIGIKKYDFSEEYITEILNEILKWEVWAQKYYSQLLNFDFSEISKELGDEPVNRIKYILKELVAWETKHVEIIEGLLSQK